MKSLTGLMQRSFSAWGTTLAAVALIITVALFSPAAGAGNDDNQERGKHNAPQIEGSWLTTVTIPDVPPWPVLLSFSAGGALVVTDSSGPPASGNVFQGTWARTGGREFTFTALGFLYDPTGVLANYIRVHETIRLEPSGNAYNSISSRIEILDVDQNVVVGPYAATTHGRRINAQ